MSPALQKKLIVALGGVGLAALATLAALLGSVAPGAPSFSALTPSTIIAQIEQSGAPAPQEEPALSLVVEPKEGVAPVLALINGATKSVDLVMYDLEDPQVEQALAAAEARGVAVRALLNQGYYGSQSKANKAAYVYFTAHQVPAHWAPAYFSLTHQKTVVVDGDEAFIMSFNLAPKYYVTSRDFGVLDKKPKDVAAIEATFESDWQGSNLAPSNGDDLVWSPGASGQLLSLIKGARKSLRVYNEEMASSAITGALLSAAASGVKVEIVMTASGQWVNAFKELAAEGAQIHLFAPKAPIYIHAKMIIADDTTAFMGSENFSGSSLNEGRELGIITSATNIVGPLMTIFDADFAAAAPFVAPTVAKPK